MVMFNGLLSASSRILDGLQRSFLGKRPTLSESAPTPAPCRSFERIARLILTDEVSRTLFGEYAAHRASDRGDEETGWVLLGIREVDRAVVLATLPAGANRDAGAAHVQFNSNAQAVASRIVRQHDSRLAMLGVVHTHPGSLRHPSGGDFQGDSLWVSVLRGGEGIFGIGTADGPRSNGLLVGSQPHSHVQCLGDLVLSWYALGEGDNQYRPLEVQLTIGPDLALPLHAIWGTIERFADPLERLCQQQAKVSFQIVPGRKGAALAVSLRLAEANSSLRVVLEQQEAAYYWQHGQEFHSLNPPADQLDRAVYLVLAELAGKM
jgi:proteasome lid subunit RPN8/RPN11